MCRMLKIVESIYLPKSLRKVRFFTKSSVDTENTLMDFKNIPGPKSYPLIGTLHKYLPLIGDYDAEALDKNALLNWKRYGSLVREAPGVNLLHVFDPDDMEMVFRQDDQHPARRSHVAMLHYRLNKPESYNTGGLLATNGPEWWRLRSTFQKKFTGPQSVKPHIQATDGIIKEFVQWIKYIGVTENDDFLNYLNRLNLEVIGTVGFNERFHSFSDSEQDPESRSSKVISAAFGSNCGIMKLDKGFLWKIFKTPLYRKLAESQDYLETVATEILLHRVNFYEADDPFTDISLLQSFLTQPNVDLKDLMGMMVDMLMAAIDTTAYATSFALYNLATNPEIQEKMFQEIAVLLPTKDAEVSSETLVKAVYVRSVIKESLRLNPVSIGVGRWLQKDIILRGYLIPKGTVIVTQNMLASRLPQFVNDPLTFKPERWIRGTQDHENIHPFLSLPFGFGPRSCIARRLAEQNMAITLIRIIREFKLHWNGKQLGVRTLLINKPDQPILLRFKPRIL
ncbi:cytochrome P450 302a1, mitochondrial isoform X2 [Plodia interpunctella]|uniref:cytochrome P450 302a1, mitochondrial isoform X2 n=1 Tax=Plodia interpunctella TaxID=58824 RepID=UPI002367A7B9|nr:cytochrome P450 302a1, mitochondrial [Plodia interpunctella]